MDLPTYTSIWRIDRRLYKLYDFRLPVPIPVVTLAVWVGIALAWVLFMRLLGVPWETDPPWHLLWIIPPLALAFATRIMVEGKRPVELLISHTRFAAEASVYCRLAAEHEPAQAAFVARVWHRHPAAAPLPLPRGGRGRRRGRTADPTEAEAPAETFTGGSEQASPSEEAGPVIEPARVAARPGEATPERTALHEDGRDGARPPEPEPAMPSMAGGPPSQVRAPGKPSSAPPPSSHDHNAPDASAQGGATDSDGAGRPSVLVRTLRYFGFALPQTEPQPSPLPPTQRDELLTARDADQAPELFGEPGNTGPQRRHRPAGAPPLGSLESAEEERESEEWFGQLRTSSGDTPWAMRSKSAASASDTAPMSPGEAWADEHETPAEAPATRTGDEELRAQRDRAQARRERSKQARRRAEELMGAAPAEDREVCLGGTRSDAPARGSTAQDTEEPPSAAEEGRERPPVSSAAQADPLYGGERARRRLRGRARGTAVSRTRDRPLRGAVTGGARDQAAQSTAEVAEKAPGAPPERASPAGGEKPQEAASSEARKAARGAPARAEPEPASTPPEHAPDAAAPPQQPKRGDERARARALTQPPPSKGTGLGLPAAPEQAGADVAAEQGKARPHAAPWDLPEDFWRGGQAMDPPEEPPTPGGEHTAYPSAEAGETSPDRQDVAASSSEPPVWETAASQGAGPQAAAENVALDDPMAGVPAKPPLELDHSTAAHARFVAGNTGACDQGPAGEPEPAAAPDAEQQPPPQRETSAPQDGETEAPESRPPGAAAAPGAAGKPDLQLDHATDAQDSFAAAMSLEARHQTAEPDTKPRRRLTIEEIEAAERAALRARRRSTDHGQAASTDTGHAAFPPEADVDSAPPGTPASEGASPPPRQPTPPQRSSRLARSMRATLTGPGRPAERRAGPVADGPAARPLDPAERARELAENRAATGEVQANTTPPRDERDGPAPRPPRHPQDLSGGDGKPDLQLDHGTAAQSALSAAGPHDHTADTPSRGSQEKAPQTRGWRRLARVVTGGRSAPNFDLSDADIARVRSSLPAPRRVVVLGCTGGAGQSVTTLLLGHILATHREQRIVAVDANPGPGGLTRRIRQETPETLTSLLANAADIGDYRAMRRYTSSAETGLEVVATLDDPYVQTLDEEDYTGLCDLLSRHYELTLLDPAATGVARALPVAEALVLVAPASADAARSVAMTFEWLDGHGYSGLRGRSVLVLNGVSKRTVSEVQRAEQVAKGRCRAIVRTPWDEHISNGKGVVAVSALRTDTRRAFGALGAVVAAGLGVAEEPAG